MNLMQAPDLGCSVVEGLRALVKRIKIETLRWELCNQKRWLLY